MSPENQSWKEKFLSIKATFKKTFFEMEMPSPQKEKNYKGLLGLIVIFLFQCLLLTQVLLMQGSNYPAQDSANLEIAYKITEVISSGDFFLLLKPEYFNIADFEPPMYYLTFVPILSVFPSKVNLAIILVNSFYMLLTCLSVFFIVRRNRNNPSVWLAISAVTSFPFMLHLSRHVLPEAALIAFVSGAYCCYINSMEFENKKWTYLFGLCIALGLWTDTSFWIYVLPIAPYVLDALLNPLIKRRVFYTVLLAFAFNAPWYFRNTFFGLLLNLFVEKSFDISTFYRAISAGDIFKNIAFLLDSVHIIFFVPCLLAVVWMFFSVFMPNWRKLVFTWFFVPYIVFSLAMPKDSKSLYPALVPLAIAVGMMTPDRIRKYFTALCLIFAFIYQSGYVSSKRAEIFGGRIALFGLDFVETGKFKNREVLEFINKENKKTGIVNVSLMSEDDYFNTNAFSVLAKKLNYKNFNFVTYGRDFLGFADFVIYKTEEKSTLRNFNKSSPLAGVDYANVSCFRRTQHEDEGEGEKIANVSAEIFKEDGWFFKAFREMAAFDLNDSVKLIVYKKELPDMNYLAPGRHFFERMSIGSINLEDVLIEAGKFNKQKKVYSYFDVFVPYLPYEGLDIYSLKVRFTDFSFVPAEDGVSDIKVLSCDKAEILLLRVLDESLTRFLRRKTTFFGNLSVKFDRGIFISGEYKNIKINAGFGLLLEPSKIGIRLNRLSLAGLGLSLDKPMSDSVELDYEDDDALLNKKIKSVLKDKNIRAKMAKAKQETAQFMDDETAKEMLEMGGYKYLLSQSAGGDTDTGAADSAELLSRKTGYLSKAIEVFLKIFSFNVNLIDEKTVPFPVSMRKISTRNGMFIVHK